LIIETIAVLTKQMALKKMHLSATERYIRTQTSYRSSSFLLKLWFHF